MSIVKQLSDCLVKYDASRASVKSDTDLSINVIEGFNSNTTIRTVTRSELSRNQELAYSFAEKMLKSGTPLLQIEAQSRLGVNGLCFCEIYRALGQAVFYGTN